MQTRTHVFERVVCGADGSEGGIAAARLAARVVAPNGSLVVVTVDDPSVAVHAGWRMADVLDELEREARTASARARAAVKGTYAHDLETRLLEGGPLECLHAEIERVRATLVVVGMHGHSRAVGITLGSVPTHLLHEARCSVLVARPAHEPAVWPQTIVVGIDGSSGSAAALVAADELAERLDARVRPVVALREPNVDLDAARALAPDLEEVDDRILPLLHELSEESALVVVGSRGLRGIRALGSVGERIAHEALSPVLVVREARA
jgi:nucleotide-binding universal stress UspA family protein